MRFLYGLLISLTALNISATNWYTCGTAPGGDLSNSSDGSNCTITGNININTGLDTLFIRSGYTRNISVFNSNTNGVIIVEGTLDLGSGNNSLNINSSGRVIVLLGGSITGSGNASLQNNGLLFIATGATVSLGTGSNADLTINGSGVTEVNGTLNVRDLINNGEITGIGDININGGTASGSGTINGQENTPTPWALPSLLDNANVWDGTSWTPTLPINASDLEDVLAIFRGNYNTATDGPINFTNAIIDPGFTVTVDDFDTFNVRARIENNGTLSLGNNTRVLTLVFLGTGNVELKRNFTRDGWHHIGFPVSAKTLGDLVTTGFNLSYSGPALNVYSWDASTSGWVAGSAGTSIVGTPFTMYVASAPASVSLTVASTEFNVGKIFQPIAYNDPGSNPPGNGTGWANGGPTDGWNMFLNTLPCYLDWDLVTAFNFLTALGKFQSNAIYVWNGTQYESYNLGGVGDARWVSPNQAFFMQAASGASGDFVTNDLMRVAIPSNSTDYFKTGNNALFTLTGEGFQATTEIVNQPTATTSFDAQFDAYYLEPINDAPIFNTVGMDSTIYSLNQLPDVMADDIFMSFYYDKNGKNFTIALDQTLASGFNYVVLEDLYTGTQTDLMQNDYNFVSNKQAPVQRFKLKFSNTSVGFDEDALNEELKMWFSGNELMIDESITLEHATVNVFDMSGRLIQAGTIGSSGIYVEQTGIFVVEVRTQEGSTFRTKVEKF